ncbi:MAG: transcriptional repressor LexA [Clostridia bacterium]|nr:transcriptional repressor LexA [Clostridia bacterium]
MSRAGSQKQMEILDFIEDFQEENGYSPSVREICAAVGLSSTSSVHQHLKSLEVKGYLIRDEKKSRVMKVVRSSREKQNTRKSFDPYQYVPTSDDEFMLHHAIEGIPIVGNVAAGVPILAEQNIEDMIPLPLSFIRGDSTDTFILNVHGDSMIQAGILDGDYVVVHSQITARNGEIVVAMIDDEVTVKRFFKEADYIRLQPENDMYSPILVRDVQILGKVVALLRQF